MLPLIKIHIIYDVYESYSDEPCSLCDGNCFVDGDQYECKRCKGSGEMNDLIKKRCNGCGGIGYGEIYLLVSYVY